MRDLENGLKNSKLKTEVFQREENLWFIVVGYCGAQQECHKKSIGSIPVTHPTEFSPSILYLFQLTSQDQLLSMNFTLFGHLRS